MELGARAAPWRHPDVGLLMAVLGLGGLGCGGPEGEAAPIVHGSFQVRADPPGGSFAGPITVTLHSEVPATLYYTTDGSAPTLRGRPYRGPLELEGEVLLKFAGVDDDGVWSEPQVALFEPLDVPYPAHVAARMLDLSRPNVYFSARPGDDLLEQTVVARSVGRQAVLIHRVYVAASPGTGTLYEPGVFRLETPVEDATRLAPGEQLELTISYRASERLRSAALVFETDDPRHEGGVMSATLSGRIFTW
jgi:hypothetical protein